LIWGWSKDKQSTTIWLLCNPDSYTYNIVIIMRRDIMCECNEITWYDENGGTVAFVDAMRFLLGICKCEVKE